MTIRDRFEKKCRCYCPSGYKLDNIKNPAVYSVDCLCKDKNAIRCDQIVICDLDASPRAGIYLIEKKGKSVRMSHIAKQLQGCADFVGKKLEQNEEFSFLPVLISDRVGHSISRNMKKKEKEIRMRGKKKRILHVRTYGALEKIEA